MRGGEFLNAVAYIDPKWIEEAESFRKRRAPLWKRIAARAAGFLLAAGSLFLLGAWLFLPVEPWEGSARMLYVRVQDKAAEYRSAALCRFDEWTLGARIGEPFGSLGTVFRLKDTETLSRLILRRRDGSFELYRFVRFEPDLTEQTVDHLIERGFFTQEDRGLVRLGAENTFGDVLVLIYNVREAGDIVSVTWEKAEFDHTKIGKSVRVPTVVMKDAADVLRAYGIFRGLVSAPDETDPPARITAQTPAYREGEAPLSIQTGRKVTLRLKNGETVSLEYDALSGVFTQTFRSLYEPVSEGDRLWIAETVGIDTEWRDHGAASQPQGMETAPPPDPGQPG